MAPRARLATDILRTLDEAPIVNTHDHLIPLEHLRNQMGIVGLLRHSYVTRSMRTADGSPNGISRSWQPAFATNSWETVEAIIAKAKFTSFYHWLIRGIAELYALPAPEISRASWEYLDAEIRRRYATDDWFSEVLSRAKMQAVIWDPFWKAGLCLGPDARVKASLRVDSSLVAFHPLASDFEGTNLVRDWADQLSVTVDSLADLEELIDKVIEMNIASGTRSIKVAIAYDRTLDISPPDRPGAARAFGTPPERLSPDQRKRFGDYVLHFYLDRCRERNLVAQFHTGLARLAGSNPLLLEPLLQAYPGVVFDLFHGGYPWVHEVAALAMNYPNVRLNLAGLPQVSPEVAIGCLKQWIQILPQVDRITWGADSFTLEESFGSLLAAKHTVSRAVAELVEDGYLTLAEGIEAAQSVLSRGGAETYGVSLPK